MKLNMSANVNDQAKRVRFQMPPVAALLSDTHREIDEPDVQPAPPPARAPPAAAAPSAAGGARGIPGPESIDPEIAARKRAILRKVTSTEV
jgi:hypothetical protein